MPSDDMIDTETLSHLLSYVARISARTPDLLLKKSVTNTELVMNCLACLTEEVGEVSAEVRKSTRLSFSRKKCDAFEKSHLEDEIVDVLITTLLLAKSAGIDSLDEAVRRKIRANEDRGYA
jgi:NTP pyrophosphatase (non-canonical NTP hydrolase)